MAYQMKSSPAKLLWALKKGAQVISKLYKRAPKTTSTTSKFRNNPTNLPGAKTDYVGNTGQVVTKTKSGSVIPVYKGKQADVTKTGIYSNEDWNILTGNK